MSHPQDREEFINDVRAGQQNIVFPDTVRNARGACAFLWNGSSHPTQVQRMGAGLIGLFLIGIGLIWFTAVGKSKAEGDYKFAFLFAVIGLLYLTAGVRVASNGLRRPNGEAVQDQE